MPTATASYQTENGRRYLIQLCKHFAHKIDVEYDAEHGGNGRCSFGPAAAKMSADDTGIRFALSAPDEESLDRGKGVIESHLVRFAFREKLERLDWKSAEPA
ncbi:DUF2218 domain-containing protein [Nitratireductor basaltis]|uniref:2,4-dihydroxyhept-2-ene-1,7-dioic acid aldolase n=1 Tax=Nitratireductor basaltis TaxID=472175 RepID=A0A084UE93_9HYPH|nr:DUF2218 domain-containing protein [Nitratireductor basaltis]KFB11279.1 hypothetical protein EL18_02327 [Nitratireductor basaltis]